jgi:hypothetical protein
MAANDDALSILSLALAVQFLDERFAILGVEVCNPDFCTVGGKKKASARQLRAQRVRAHVPASDELDGERATDARSTSSDESKVTRFVRHGYAGRNSYGRWGWRKIGKEIDPR